MTTETFDHATRTICLQSGNIYTPVGIVRDGRIVIHDGHIVAVGDRSDVNAPVDAEVIEVAGHMVLPGLIDLHVHGIEGHDVADGDLGHIGMALARRGVTTFLAALTPAPREQLLGSIDHVASYAIASSSDSHIRANHGARLGGIYLEGPYVSPTRAGALDVGAFRLPNIAETAEMARVGRGQIRVMALAPELPGALELIKFLSQKHIVAAVGHSDASYDQVCTAVDYGLRHATHTFNAMRPFQHREPGVVGAVLDREEIFVEIIADGHHVHPAAIRLLWHVKGPDRTCLVSDLLPLAGLQPGNYSWLGQRIEIEGDAVEGRARTESGTLAGSVTTLNLSLRNLVTMTGAPLEVALKTATSVPARVLSLNSGALEVGKDADIAVLDEAFEPCFTIVRGDVVFRK